MVLEPNHRDMFSFRGFAVPARASYHFPFTGIDKAVEDVGRTDRLRSLAIRPRFLRVERSRFFDHAV